MWWSLLIFQLDYICDSPTQLPKKQEIYSASIGYDHAIFFPKGMECKRPKGKKYSVTDLHPHVNPTPDGSFSVQKAENPGSHGSSKSRQVSKKPVPPGESPILAPVEENLVPLFVPIPTWPGNAEKPVEQVVVRTYYDEYKPNLVGFDARFHPCGLHDDSNYDIDTSITDQFSDEGAQDELHIIVNPINDDAQSGFLPNEDINTTALSLPALIKIPSFASTPLDTADSWDNDCSFDPVQEDQFEGASNCFTHQSYHDDEPQRGIKRKWDCGDAFFQEPSKRFKYDTSSQFLIVI